MPTKTKILLSSIVASTIIQAQNIDLGEVTVTTATKTQKNIDGVSASVIVLDEKRIEEMGASTLGDVISKTPGLTRQYGTFPSASSKSKSSVSFRGMGATGTLFLIDGERLAGEVKNPYDLDRIPANIIERIEIVKGPMSTLYGADAVGGIINIITKQPKEGFQGSLGIKTGSNSDGDGANTNIDFSLRGKEDKVSYSIYGSGISSDPYYQTERAHVLLPTPKGKVSPSKHPHPKSSSIHDTYDTDVTYREEAEVLHGGVKLGYDISDDLKANISFSYMDEERDGVYNGFFHPTAFKMPNGKPIPAYTVPVNSNDTNTRQSVAGDIRWNASEDLSLKLKIYNNYYEKRNSTTMKHWQDFGYSSEEQSMANGMNADVDITSYELSGNYALGEEHLLTFGTEYRDEKRDATVFDSTPNMSRKEVDYQALYLQDEWEASDTLNFILGARYDAISNAENKATIKIGAVKNFSELINLRFNFAQGYRTPDIREMYINKQTPNGLQQGAEVVGYDLKPEFTNSIEVGSRGKMAGVGYTIAIFYNDIEDRIEKVPGIQPNSYTFVNISDAITKGLEATIDYDFENGLYLGLTYNGLDTEDKSTGKELEFNPDMTISLEARYNITENFNIGAIAIYTGEQYYKKQTQKGRVDATTEEFTLVDFTTSYKFGKDNNYEIYGGVNNLLDEDVEDILGSTVGAYYYIGARVKF